MGTPLRLLFLAAFVCVGYVLYTQAEVQAHLAEPDNTKVALLFAGTLLDGLCVAAILAFTIVPMIGQSVGGFFFNPGTEVEKDPHSDAIAKLAQGDPEGAIGVYESILGKDPNDSLAISEIARICCRNLSDPARAAAYLERALEREWPQEQVSFLGNRLADVYLLQEEPMRARQIIVQIAENMPDTKFAANAQHRLHEIDRGIESPSSPQRSLPGADQTGRRRV
jgi:tetratricopeptide (TPR) repeat protein